MAPDRDNEFPSVFGQMDVTEINTTKEFCKALEEGVSKHIIEGIRNVPSKELDINDEILWSEYKVYFGLLLNPELELGEFKYAGDAYPDSEICIQSIDTERKYLGKDILDSLKVGVFLPLCPDLVDPSYTLGRMKKKAIENNSSDEERDILREAVISRQYIYTFVIDKMQLAKELPFEETLRFIDALKKVQEVGSSK
jgi:hypothetical protein